MERKLNKEYFEKYFFYGLENRDEIIKWIIVNVAKQRIGTHNTLDTYNDKMGYEKDEEAILELMVQLERFTSLHDDPEHRSYFYNDINTDSIQIHQMFNRNLLAIKETNALSFVSYRPISGIYFNTYGYSEEVQNQYGKCNGEEFLAQLKQTSAWAGEVYDVLCYLNELEKEDRFEYYSLFLDSKYARAIDRNRKGITDDREIHEIKNVYRKFLKRKTSIKS